MSTVELTGSALAGRNEGAVERMTESVILPT